MRRPTARRERGAASVFLSAAALVLVATAVAVAATLPVVWARHRAAAAADLAALAAAGRWWGGTAAACGLARQIATSNGAVLQSCQLDGAQVQVSTSVAVPGPAAHFVGPVHRAARAGPGERGAGQPG